MKTLAKENGYESFFVSRECSTDRTILVYSSILRASASRCRQTEGGFVIHVEQSGADDQEEAESGEMLADERMVKVHRCHGLRTVEIVAIIFHSNFLPLLPLGFLFVSTPPTHTLYFPSFFSPLHTRFSESLIILFDHTPPSLFLLYTHPHFHQHHN